MTELDLFGEPVRVVAPVQVGKRKPTPPRGHVAPPGSGPKGETCRTCAHYTRRHYHDYVHLKCGLNKANWTKGPGSDIRAKDAACRKWEAA